MVGPRAMQPPTALPLYIKNNIIQILKRWNWKALQYSGAKQFRRSDPLQSFQWLPSHATSKPQSFEWPPGPRATSLTSFAPFSLYYSTPSPLATSYLQPIKHIRIPCHFFNRVTAPGACFIFLHGTKPHWHSVDLLVSLCPVCLPLECKLCDERGCAYFDHSYVFPASRTVLASSTQYLFVKWLNKHTY